MSIGPSQEFGLLFDFIRNGMNIQQDKSGIGFPITRIETISDGIVDMSRVGYAGLENGDAEKWLLEPGDILFSHINSVEHIGKCAIYEGSDPPLVHGMNLLCLRPNRYKLWPSYAKWLIKSPGFKALLMPFVNKAVNQASISINNLKNIRVGVASLADQIRIATILDQAESVRQMHLSAASKAGDLLQTLSQRAFCGEL